MRPIKFRAWDKKEERMISFEELEERNSVHDFLDEYINPFQEMTSEYRGDRNYQQYTGLKDKNGREIYEGDVVKVIHDDGFETIGQVEWGLSSKGFGTYPAFAIHELESEMNSFSEIFDTGHYTIEVIGNIYEDKHPLEGESNDQETSQEGTS